MPIHLLGGGGGNEPPFNRAFFNTKLADMIARNGEREHRLTLYLVDGSTLEVCEILELSDQYMSLKAFNPTEDTCELAVTVIPYGVIYRMELSPKEVGAERVGFHFKPAEPRRTGRKPR
jgi:hypothetical protein